MTELNENPAAQLSTESLNLEPQVEPCWSDPEAAEQLNQMSPAEVLGLVREFISRFLVCSDDQLTLLALWVLHTHCHRAFVSTPYLDIRSAEKGCGKTICLQVLNVLCRKP